MDDLQLRAEPVPPTARRGAATDAGGLRPAPPRQAGFADRYSIFVGWMKWLLPAAAIGLVGLVMMWPQLERVGEQAERSLMASLAPEDVANIQLVNPRYMGTDDKNRPYMLTADVARQTNPEADLVTLEAPKADITLEDGTWLALTARNGAYFQKSEELNLNGTVTIFHDQGYSFETDEARVDLQAGTAEGDMPVIAHGPLGTLESQGFRVLERGQTVIFKGEARLVMYPDENGESFLPLPAAGPGARADDTADE